MKRQDRAIAYPAMIGIAFLIIAGLSIAFVGPIFTDLTDTADEKNAGLRYEDPADEGTGYLRDVEGSLPWVGMLLLGAFLFAQATYLSARGR
jgi:hypothetical protein